VNVAKVSATENSGNGVSAWKRDDEIETEAANGGGMVEESAAARQAETA
jgi:hypothetical protein